MRLPFRTLALAGGGMKGVLHIGALRELEKRQPLIFPDGVYGSSVGSIIGTYVAFGIPLDKAPALIKSHMSINSIFPPLQVNSIANAFTTKGVCGLEHLESQLLKVFDAGGLDIRTAKISDARMPLYIVASNLTTGVPSLFSGNVPLLDALKASCCFPGAFRPYELYGNLYIDGDILTPCISSVLPRIDSETLILGLKKLRKYKLTPRQVESMSPFDYIREIHTLGLRMAQKFHMNDQTLLLQYPNLESSSDISGMDLDDMLSSAGRQLAGFLNSNGTRKEST
jgi:predicted acylesterase/phospholipase RssA